MAKLTKKQQLLSDANGLQQSVCNMADRIEAETSIAVFNLDKLTIKELENAIVTMTDTLAQLTEAYTKEQAAKPVADKPAPKAKVDKSKKIDVNRCKSALIKANFKLNKKTQVYTDARGVNVRFSTKSVQMTYKTEALSIQLIGNDNGYFVEQLQYLRKNGVIKPTKATTGVVETKTKKGDKMTETKAAPKAGALTEDGKDLPGINKDAAKTPKQLAAEKKAAEKKVEPKKPVNPAGNDTPVFDELQAAINEDAKFIAKIDSIWKPLAKKYDYSITPLVAALHAEGRWMDKTNSKGAVVQQDGFTIPMGYQKVMRLETEKGIIGAGNFVNRASRMFAEHNPANTPEAKEARRLEKEKKNPTKVPASTSEKTVEKMLMEMNNLAKKLKPEDLKSWLEANENTIPLIEQIIEERNALAELA